MGDNVWLVALSVVRYYRLAQENNIKNRGKICHDLIVTIGAFSFLAWLCTYAKF